MFASGRIVALLTLVLLALFDLSTAGAHDLPMNAIMNAFVRVQPQTLDLVVRVPMDLLRGIPFPRKGDNYDTAAAGPTMDLALSILTDGFRIAENGTLLVPKAAQARMASPTDRSFDSFDDAIAAVNKPTASDEAVVPFDKGTLDVHFEYPIQSATAVFTIQTLLAADLGSGAMMTVRYLAADSASRAMVINSGADPVPLNPTWYFAAGSFVKLGVEHILTGFDHLLFLFALVIPFRRLKGLIGVITAFTFSHSVTLIASAFHLAPQGLWFPPLVEMGIAASIVYAAGENVVGVSLHRRWLVAGFFGLIHGFGFSNALGQSLQFAGSYLLLSLLAFNVGIELGQLCVLAVMLPVLALLRRVVPNRVLVVGLSTVVGIVGLYWMGERWLVLKGTGLPSPDMRGMAQLAAGIVAVLAAAGALKLIAGWAQRRARRRSAFPIQGLRP